MDEIDSKALEAARLAFEAWFYDETGYQALRIGLTYRGEAHELWVGWKAATTKLAALEDENKTLRALFDEYGTHHEDCDMAGPVCSCGMRQRYRAALSKPAALPAEGMGEYGDPIRNEAGKIVAYLDESGNVGWVGTNRATPPAPQPLEGAVKVKELEWTQVIPGRLFADLYMIERLYLDDWRLYLRSHKHEDWPRCIGGPFSLDEAKAAAQADYERRILSSLSPAPQPVGEVRATHRHKKRDSEYVLLGIGKMQAARWNEHGTNPDGGFIVSVDMREVAVYRSVTDGQLWVRPREEFDDGRFEALSASPSPAAQESPDAQS